MSLSQLNELYLELEVLIREFSETLIAELALRDELEYEKELKNTFISLLLAVQNKRRQYHVERKRTGRNSTAPRALNGLDPKVRKRVVLFHGHFLHLDKPVLFFGITYSGLWLVAKFKHILCTNSVNLKCMVQC